MKKKLIPVGFYRELRHGSATGPSLHEAIGAEPGPDQAKIVGYLQAGHAFIVAPGLVRDILANNAIIGALTIQTDGTYAWPSDFPHYIEKHHARPPAELVEHVRASQFTMPADVDVSTLELGS